MNLDKEIIMNLHDGKDCSGTLFATDKAHGLYSPSHFVLRLSPKNHRILSGLPSGLSFGSNRDPEVYQAFSTYLHETVHWWQHVGSTSGLMQSLSVPAQMFANFGSIKRLLKLVGPKKSIRALSEAIPSTGDPNSEGGLAAIISNNFFDISAFYFLVTRPDEARKIVNSPYFESVGHAYYISYSNIVANIAGSIDEPFSVFPNPKAWSDGFTMLRESKAANFHYGSDVTLSPIGARYIFEGQARFCQLQYLYFSSRGKLSWKDVEDAGMFGDTYVRAFNAYLKMTGLQWPNSIDDPVVALFLLICDMAINPGTGFPFSIDCYETFLEDVDPGWRFIYLCHIVGTRCPELASTIQSYSRDEYVSVSTRLANELLIHSPISISGEISGWSNRSNIIKDLMDEYDVYKFEDKNLIIRFLLAHHISFNRDKFLMPEFFCWPGTWMYGDRFRDQIGEAFSRHGAPFIDKEDDDGVFPVIRPNLSPENIYETFNKFYQYVVAFDMTEQLINDNGPFRYDFKWLSCFAKAGEIKNFVDDMFFHAYGIYPDDFSIL